MWESLNVLGQHIGRIPHYYFRGFSSLRIGEGGEGAWKGDLMMHCYRAEIEKWRRRKKLTLSLPTLSSKGGAQNCAIKLRRHERKRRKPWPRLLSPSRKTWIIKSAATDLCAFLSTKSLSKIRKNLVRFMLWRQGRDVLSRDSGVRCRYYIRSLCCVEGYGWSSRIGVPLIQTLACASFLPSFLAFATMMPNESESWTNSWICQKYLSMGRVSALKTMNFTSTHSERKLLIINNIFFARIRPYSWWVDSPHHVSYASTSSTSPPPHSAVYMGTTHSPKNPGWIFARHQNLWVAQTECGNGGIGIERTFYIPRHDDHTTPTFVPEKRRINGHDSISRKQYRGIFLLYSNFGRVSAFGKRMEVRVHKNVMPREGRRWKIEAISFFGKRCWSISIWKNAFLSFSSLSPLASR